MLVELQKELGLSLLFISHDIGTGAHAYHGPYEHISVQSMDKVVDMVIELVKIYSTFSK